MPAKIDRSEMPRVLKGCVGKARHLDEASARTIVRRMMRYRNVREKLGDRLFLEVYRCPRCSFIHIGKSPKES